MAHPTRSRCGLCHKEMPIYFFVTDEIWEAAIPEPIQASEICLSCFIGFADNKMLRWEEGIVFYPTSWITHLERNGWTRKVDNA